MKGCLGVGLVIAAILALIGFGAVKLFQGAIFSVENFPEYAEKDAVYARYGSFIEEVQTTIDASQSMHDLAARLEKISMPEELVYLTLIKEDGDPFDSDDLEIVKKFDVKSKQHTIINGTGYGKLNDVPVIVINVPVNRHSIEESYIYLRHDEPAPSPDQT